MYSTPFTRWDRMYNFHLITIISFCTRHMCLVLSNNNHTFYLSISNVLSLNNWPVPRVYLIALSKCFFVKKYLYSTFAVCITKYTQFGKEFYINTHTANRLFVRLFVWK